MAILSGRALYNENGAGGRDPDAVSDHCERVSSTLRMAANSVLPLIADEKVAFVAALKRSIDGDRFPLSLRVRTLQSILARLEPAPAPLPRRRHYEPPRHMQAQRRAR